MKKLLSVILVALSALAFAAPSVWADDDDDDDHRHKFRNFSHQIGCKILMAGVDLEAEPPLVTIGGTNLIRESSVPRVFLGGMELNVVASTEDQIEAEVNQADLPLDAKSYRLQVIRKPWDRWCNSFEVTAVAPGVTGGTGGLTGHEIIEVARQVNELQAGQEVAIVPLFCSGVKILTGGSAISTNPQVPLVFSGPITDPSQGWQAMVRNVSEVTQNAEVFLHVICADGSS